MLAYDTVDAIGADDDGAGEGGAVRAGGEDAGVGGGDGCDFLVGVDSGLGGFGEGVVEDLQKIVASYDPG